MYPESFQKIQQFAIALSINMLEYKKMFSKQVFHKLLKISGLQKTLFCGIPLILHGIRKIVFWKVLKAWVIIRVSAELSFGFYNPHAWNY